MYFWDSSAIIPLLVEEQSTDRLRPLHAAVPAIATSFISAVEVTSGLWRRRHAQLLTVDEHFSADEGFAMLSTSWLEVGDVDAVIATAIELLSRHHLRAGDAIQLASALVAAEGVPADLPFVTLDHDLATAARAEGFPVLP